MVFACYSLEAPVVTATRWHQRTRERGKFKRPKPTHPLLYSLKCDKSSGRVLKILQTSTAAVMVVVVVVGRGWAGCL